MDRDYGVAGAPFWLLCCVCDGVFINGSGSGVNLLVASPEPSLTARERCMVLEVSLMERRELVKKLLALASVPAVAKVFPQGQALAQALDTPRVMKAGT